MRARSGLSVGIGRPREVQQVAGDGGGVGLELRAVRAMELGHAHEHLRPGRLAATAVLGREVGAAEEGPAIGEAKAV